MIDPVSMRDGVLARDPSQAIGGLQFLQINLRYSHFGFTMLQQFLRNNQKDVILIQDPPMDILTGQGYLPGYDFLVSSDCVPLDHSARPLAAILIRSSLTFERISGSHRRICGALISTRRGRLAIFSAYIHHVDGDGLDALSSFVTSARSRTPLLLVGADCNGHSSWWGPPETTTNAVGALIEDFILQEHLHVGNRWPCPPTFHSDMGFQTWIDVTLTSSGLASSLTGWRVLDDVYIDSDHSALAYTIRLDPDRATEPRLDWRHVPWPEFRHTLEEALSTHFPHLPELEDPSSLDAAVTTLTAALHSTVEAHVPLKRVGPASHPWWSPHLSALRAEHLRARRRWKRTLSHADRRAANTCKRTLRNAIICAKRQCWRQFCEDTTPADMWSSFTRVSRPPASHCVRPLVHEGVQFHDAVSQTRILSERFFPTSVGPETAFHRHIQSEVGARMLDIRTAPSSPVTPQELHSAISSSGPWKAPGPDGLPYVCFRQCEDILTPILLCIFSASLRLGHVPASWKVAIVVPVPKPGGDLTSPKGFRPISLLSTLAKLLERIITDRLTFFLETHRCLAPSQYGFRQGRGTDEALWHLVSAASAAMQTRRRLCLVSLDIQGAYDTVWHMGLLWKLSQLGVPDDLVRWVASFLSSREARVRLRTAITSRHLDMGVPQGSPLSPVLFLVYVNDLLIALRSIQGAFGQAFADDLASWWLESAHTPSPSPGLRISQTIQTWASQWRMVFNPAKCQVLSIGRISAPPPVFVLGDVQLACVPYLRYLGVWLDSTLSWREHIRRVSQRALGRLRLLHRGAGTLWGFHPVIFRRLVEAVVLPTLFFAAPVWCTAVCRLSSLAPLDRVIRHCSIASFGLLRTVSHAASQMLAGFLPAEFQLRRRTVDFYLRRLTYGEDLLAVETPRTVNQTVSPIDILRLEVRQLQRLSSVPSSVFSTVETHALWFMDPASASCPFTVSILDRDAAIARLRAARQASPPTALWVFTDGSVDGRLCGAAALLFSGSSMTPTTYVVRFSGHHSSTQAEVVALLLGCQGVLHHGPISSVTFVSDSQAALLPLSQSRRSLHLSAELRLNLMDLCASIPEVRLWWVPGHSSVIENDMADFAAKAAAQGESPQADVVPTPSCRSGLRTLICRHYVSRLEAQWHVAHTGRDLHDIMPRFTRCLRWTAGLSRRQVALTSQFLTGHYATHAYLFRFGSRSDPCCGWCSAPVDDRQHRLFTCPRFARLRHRLTLEVESATRGDHSWTWDFLVGPGRRYLARFLDPVRDAIPDDAP